jgi:regulator of protease activity HflC (stomatin/prohibitin superfamily)
MNKEKSISGINGWLVLFLTLAMYGLAGWGIYFIIAEAIRTDSPPSWYSIVVNIILWLAAGLMSGGFFVIEPNGSKVVLLFGKYLGSVKKSGFWWINPLTSRRSVSLRARTLNLDRLKVNDLSGNPVEIAAVFVWRVVDTFAASFEVDDYEDYVALQGETALRHVASSYPYDADDETVSLRRNTTEVSEHLREELQSSLSRAGVEVMEARLSHLAYAPEIAGAMLRRQQAAAIIAARQKIVEGAVGMVESALEQLEASRAVELNEERRAAMVSNLLVVLCSEQAAAPVLNAGTLYH